MSAERPFRPSSGFAFLLVVLLCLGAAVGSIALGAATRNGVFAVPAVAFGIATVLACCGFFIVNPNDAKVVTLFGRYVGSVKENGFYWVNPFSVRRRVSLRARNLNGEKLKVNDKAGNPIEIAAVVVWEVRDTFAALFDVDHYDEYVSTQSESALRHLASAYHYDGDDGEVTLRGSTDEVGTHLAKELQERLQRAGVHVLEARLMHLAYAPEIAHAMLQRQQASAVIAARTKIVEGAVGMVEMALKELERSKQVTLDEERKASMVSNLLVVLCGERTTPVINTGTLYN